MVKIGKFGLSKETEELRLGLSIEVKRSHLAIVLKSVSFQIIS